MQAKKEEKPILSSHISLTVTATFSSLEEILLPLTRDIRIIGPRLPKIERRAYLNFASKEEASRIIERGLSFQGEPLTLRFHPCPKRLTCQGCQDVRRPEDLPQLSQELHSVKQEDSVSIQLDFNLKIADVCRRWRWILLQSLRKRILKLYPRRYPNLQSRWNISS